MGHPLHYRPPVPVAAMPAAEPGFAFARRPVQDVVPDVVQAVPRYPPGWTELHQRHLLQNLHQHPAYHGVHPALYAAAAAHHPLFPAGCALPSDAEYLHHQRLQTLQTPTACPAYMSMLGFKTSPRRSAFQAVGSTPSTDLRYLPSPYSAAALHPEEKGAITDYPTIQECQSSAHSAIRHRLTPTDVVKKVEEPAHDLKRLESKLPIKKQKQRLHHSLSVLQDRISLTGRLNFWDKDQVQLWLGKTLNDSKKFKPETILKTLEKLKEESGRGLVSFTKDQWKEKLSDCDDPTASVRMWEFVWTLVMERLNDTPLRPHNCSTELSTRAIENYESSIMHAPYTVGGNILDPAGTTPPYSPAERSTREIENHGLSTMQPYYAAVGNIPDPAATTMAPKRPTKPPRKRRDKCVGQLWEFVYNLLQNKDMENVVRWEDKEKLLFRIVNTEEIAKLWGNHKGNRNMTYANMSRTMRYYRKGNGAFVKNERKRVYGFGPKADFKRLEAKPGRLNRIYDQGK